MRGADNKKARMRRALCFWLHTDARAQKTPSSASTMTRLSGTPSNHRIIGIDSPPFVIVRATTTQKRSGSENDELHTSPAAASSGSRRRPSEYFLISSSALPSSTSAGMTPGHSVDAPRNHAACRSRARCETCCPESAVAHVPGFADPARRRDAASSRPSISSTSIGSPR